MNEKENSALLHSSEYTITIHFKLIFNKSPCIIGLCTFTELPKSVSLKEKHNGRNPGSRKRNKGKRLEIFKMTIMRFDCLKAAFATSSGVTATSAVAEGGNGPLLLTLMAPRCPKAALTSKQDSHSYFYSNDENGSVKTNSKQKADYKMSECFLLCLRIS